MASLTSDLRNFTKGYIDTFVYDEKAWSDRGESIGRGSLATLLAEGRLYSELNGHDGRATYDLVSGKLEAIAKRHGCFVEQGYAWSWHFYPA